MSPVGGRRSELAGHVALGCAGFSLSGADTSEHAGDVIRAAADAGIWIFDSARAYATPDDPLHNESLVARALAGRDDVLIATKGGHFRTGERSWDVDNSPDRLRRDVDDSLRALGAEQIGLYFLHRSDGRAGLEGRDASPDPIGASVAALDELRRQGKLARVGLSNVTVAQLHEALAIAPIDAVQNRLSALDMEKPDVLRYCEELGIAFFAYSPLRDGGVGPLAAQRFPRTFAAARSRGVSLQRVLLRGLLVSSRSVSLVVGAGQVSTATDAAAAMREHWDDELATAFCADRHAWGTACPRGDG